MCITVQDSLHKTPVWKRNGDTHYRISPVMHKLEISFDGILAEGENPRELVFSVLKRIRPLSKVLPFSGHTDFQLLTGNEV